MNHRNIAILKIKSAYYCCITRGITKIEAINLMKNIDLTKNRETLKKLLKLNIKNNF